MTCILIFSWGLTTLQAQSANGTTDEYPKEKAEILQTWNEIVESVKAGDVDSDVDK